MGAGMADADDMADEIEVKKRAQLYSGNFDPYHGHYVRMMAKLSEGHMVVCDQHTNPDLRMDYNVQVVEVTHADWIPLANTRMGGTLGPPSYTSEGFWWDSGAADIHRVSDTRALLLGITLGDPRPAPATGYWKVNHLKLLEFAEDGSATTVNTIQVAAEIMDKPNYSLRLYALNDGRFLLVAWPGYQTQPSLFYRIRVDANTIIVEQTGSGPPVDSFVEGRFCTPLIFDDVVIFPTGRKDPTSTFSNLPSLWPLNIDTLTMGAMIEPWPVTNPAPDGRLTRATAQVGSVIDSTTAVLALSVYDASWNMEDHLFTVTVSGGAVTMTPLSAELWPGNTEDPNGGTWIDPARPATATSSKVLFGTGLSVMVTIDADTVAWIVKIGDASWDDNELGVFYWRWRDGTLVDWHLLKGDLFIDTEPEDMWLFEDSLRRPIALGAMAGGNIVVLLSEYYEVTGGGQNGWDWYNNIYLALMSLASGTITGNLIGSRRAFTAGHHRA